MTEMIMEQARKKKKQPEQKKWLEPYWAGRDIHKRSFTF